MQAIIAAESGGVSVCIDFGVGILGFFPLGFAFLVCLALELSNDFQGVDFIDVQRHGAFSFLFFVVLLS